MSLVVAVSAYDRIVLLSDGLSVDSQSGTPVPIPKLYRLTDNSAAGIAGSWLIGDIARFMKSISEESTQQNLTDVNGVAELIAERIHAREWAHNDDSEIELLVAGYAERTPTIRLIQKQGVSYRDPLGLIGVRFSAYAIGSWNGARELLPRLLGDKIGHPERIDPIVAKDAAIDILRQGAKAVPSEIGGRPSIWHIFPDRIEVAR
jgi:20S proteasome alpha/beta subunit